ncbi:MAG: hypothetical protein RR721_03825 [Aeromonas sp.]|uniref:hypothetical protein n=1 Tax=Aeromonas sp. TaxID=647 RepID=UPI002FC6E50C
MYSEMITPKIDKLFDDLRAEVQKIVVDSNSAHEAMNRIFQRVSSETSLRSKTMLSDMLFNFDDEIRQTPFFADIARQNKFTVINLRQEILSKYQFSINTAVDYKETARIKHATKVGCGIFIIGGVCGIGAALISGFSLSNLVPIPVGVLVMAVFGSAAMDYIVIAPNQNKKNLYLAIDNYLIDVQQQFMRWLDSVESYYNDRANEIKKMI